MMVRKGSHPQMALFQASELIQLTQMFVNMCTFALQSALHVKGSEPPQDISSEQDAHAPHTIFDHETD